MALIPNLKALIRTYAPRPLIEWWQRRANAKFANVPPQAVFRDIYQKNSWGDTESVSGGGSTVNATSVAREVIEKLVRELNVGVFHDIPCGDFNWMRHVDLGACRYIGSDIVPELVEETRAKYAAHNRTFGVLNLITDQLPSADLMLVRDCFIHLSYNDIFAALRNVKSSGSKYLLTNTYPDHRRNYDTNTGGARPLNMSLAPFQFPEPLHFVRETVVADAVGAAGKTLVLYRIADLPDQPRA